MRRYCRKASANVRLFFELQNFFHFFFKKSAKNLVFSIQTVPKAGRASAEEPDCQQQHSVHLPLICTAKITITSEITSSLLEYFKATTRKSVVCDAEARALVATTEAFALPRSVLCTELQFPRGVRLAAPRKIFEVTLPFLFPLSSFIFHLSTTFSPLPAL